MTTPSDIVNRALGAIGRNDLLIGDIGEGTEGAKPALLVYRSCRQQLIRAAHWSWSRKKAELTLLGDVTGQTPNVSQIVQTPWTYAYEQPIDCLKARFVPWNNTSPQPTPPPTPVSNNPPLYNVRLIPAPFLLSLSSDYPVTLGAGDQTEWWDLQGVGPVDRTVILTNVKCASLVYTADVVYPSQWDSLFEEALVQVIAAKIALGLARDPKTGLLLRGECMKSAKGMITEARLTNANESGFPQTTDHTPDWIRARDRGGSNWGYAGMAAIGGGFAPGGWGYDVGSWPDGSVF